ncbi:MAG: hypothetical protein NZO58_01205 [Gemmataceae bacterium]|nr:hypothetical protein [Gemmataceae bacterium]
MTSRRRYRLCCEPLEDRLAPAGNVTVAPLSRTGDLRISGDDANNHIRIDLTPATDTTPARITVSSGDDPTQINGSAINPTVIDLPATGLRNLVIDMGAANATVNGQVFAATDFVTIQGDLGVPIQGTLTIQGLFDGAVALRSVRVNGAATLKFGNGPPGGQNIGQSAALVTDCRLGPLSITTGNNADVIELRNSIFRGAVTIKTSGGDDQVNVLGDYQPSGNVLVDAPTISGSVTVETGADDDNIVVERHFIAGAVSLKAGPAANDLLQLIRLAHCVVGISANLVQSSKIKAAEAALSADGVVLSADGRLVRGRDTVQVEDVITGKGLTIATKVSNDLVFVENTYVGRAAAAKLTITTGDGNDAVHGNGTVDRDHVVRPQDQSGAGDDGNRVNGTTTIDVGNGDDQVLVGTEQLTGRHRFQGATSIGLGEGNNTLALLGALTGTSAATFASTTTFEGDLTVNGGNGFEGILAIGTVMRRKMTLNLKAGESIVAATNSALLGAFSMAAPGGRSIVGLGATELGSLAAQNFLGGAVTITTGAGNEYVEVRNATIIGAVKLTLTAGRDQVLVANSDVNQQTAAINGGGLPENNRGSVNGTDLAVLGAPGFSPGGVDADFGQVVDDAVDAVFGDILDAIRGLFP